MVLSQLALNGIFIPNCRDPLPNNHPSDGIIYNSRAKILTYILTYSRDCYNYHCLTGVEQGVGSLEVLYLKSSSKPVAELAPVPKTVCCSFLAVDQKEYKENYLLNLFT